MNAKKGSLLFSMFLFSFLWNSCCILHQNIFLLLKNVYFTSWTGIIFLSHASHKAIPGISGPTSPIMQRVITWDITLMQLSKPLMGLESCWSLSYQWILNSREVLQRNLNGVAHSEEGGNADLVLLYDSKCFHSLKF